ncbi:hypothetical protein [Achromobacter mucicolens]|uniref:hypothetical protein n=1 Tax=Achromobacter mucicolens TaxID=1389922 RepID=UPI0015821B76|nr:hypothetical protein [Achromobacter mucicolens]
MTKKNPHAGKPGAYTTVIKLDKAVIDPGDYLRANFFVSGYGQIDQAKLLLIAPDGVPQGFCSSGFTQKLIAPNQVEIRQGGKKERIEREFVIAIATKVSVPHPNGGTVVITPFSDAGGNTHAIHSETRRPDPMLAVEYQIPHDFLPGTYKLTSVFTYFNGINWVSDRLEAQYVVRSVFQRHESTIAGIACAAAIATIVAALLTPIGTLFTLMQLLSAN